MFQMAASDLEWVFMAQLITSSGRAYFFQSFNKKN